MCVYKLFGIFEFIVLLLLFSSLNNDFKFDVFVKSFLDFVKIVLILCIYIFIVHAQVHSIIYAKFRYIINFTILKLPCTV